jgi:hypothetical protein
MNSKSLNFYLPVLLLSFTGCETIFNFAPPPPPPATEGSDIALVVIDFRTAAISSDHYKIAYYNRGASAANSFQLFDVPIIGAAITAVAGAAFKSSTDLPLGAGITGGSLAVLENFYDPRDRALIYFGGQAAMSCMERLAAQGALAYQNDTLSQPALASIRSQIQNTTTSTPQLAGLQKSITVFNNGPSEIDDAINSVNASVTKQAITKAARPNMQDIANNIKQATTQASTNKTNNRQIDVSALVVSARRKLDLRTQAVITQAQIELQVGQILNYSAEFDQNLIACKAFAG